MKELSNWKEISKGYYRYVIAANACYEIIINHHAIGTDILTADANLYITGTWHNKDGSSTFERFSIARELPIQELLEIAYLDNEQNNNTK